MRRDNDRHLTRCERLQSLQKFCFAANIKVSRRLIQEQDLWFLQDNAREPDCLLLSTRKTTSALGNGHVVAQRVPCNKRLYASEAGRRQHLFVGGIRFTERNIVAQ